ncbi:hypothetical protein M413DRAFT_222754 [Hebeloma cylindrosporum]|uniref:Uncharacterized protein n=1 Tax=Hebeloma cylindrosporum TaxID=76867 RepID=A0A0C3CHF8_HEBCY|nr:hypothetical protein M413DRAFT_222754 [Hebeloma cylindrosporum h7]
MDSFSLHYDYTQATDYTGAIYTAPPIPQHPPLQLYAPIPLPGQSALLYSEPEPVHPYGEPSPDAQYYEEPLPEFIPLRPCDLPNPPLDINYLAGDPQQVTFPTPSELLAELAAKGLPPTSDEFASDVRSESASKARRRAMAKSIGFVPTDPDTISSHDKKRHYLECLEQYVLYLHQQIESVVGATPSPLVRTSSYPGLTSRSIRTLLVHMEHQTRRLNINTLSEEQRFLNLRDRVMQRAGCADQLPS